MESELIRMTPKILKLTSEVDDCQKTSSIAEIAQFSINPDIQDELMEFIKKKVLISNTLQQYIIGKEIEFWESYISILNVQDQKCSCESSCGSMEIVENSETKEYKCSKSSCEENESEFEYAENQLKGLKSQMKNVLRRSQKASDYLSSKNEQFKITTSYFGGEQSERRYITENKEWMNSLRNSMSLQKIKLILEKLMGMDLKLDATFWELEVFSIFRSLTYSERLAASGILIEMVIWASMYSSNSFLLKLLNVFIEKEEFKCYVFSSLDQIIWFQELNIRRNLWSCKLLVSLFAEFSENNEFYREKYGQIISEVMIKTMEFVEFESENLIFLIEVFESFGQQSTWFFERFDQVFTVFKSKTTLIESSERVTEFLNFHSSVLLSINSSVCIETVSEVTQNEIVLTQEKIDEIEQELRIKMEEDFKIQLEKREEEWKMKKQEEVIEIEKEIRIKVKEELRLEEQKRKQEEDRKKKELEEEKRKKIEDAKKAEELKIRKQKEEYKKNNPCIFLTAGVRIYKHTNPGHHYERDVFDGKLIGLLFSGSWCQPCLNFLPYLKNFHAQVKEDFEVLFISSDRSEQEMNSFLKNYHGDWFNYPFGSCEGIRLNNNLGVQSIPTLLVFKPNGTYRSVNKTNEVMNCQNPQALVNQWKNM
ncbi:unnamed protein product [Caenorhabditis brenneri]